MRGRINFHRVCFVSEELKVFWSRMKLQVKNRRNFSSRDFRFDRSTSQAISPPLLLSIDSSRGRRRTMQVYMISTKRVSIDHLFPRLLRFSNCFPFPLARDIPRSLLRTPTRCDSRQKDFRITRREVDERNRTFRRSLFRSPSSSSGRTRFRSRG